jgi:HSP20 family protein
MLFGGNIVVETLRLSSVICAYPDDNYENLEIEVVLPGVKKTEIYFKISESCFYIKASKEGAQYADSYSICCPVKIE